MTQYKFNDINPDVETGTTLASSLNSWKAAVESGHSGSSRPVYIRAGMSWVNTSSNPWKCYLFDGTDDVLVGLLDYSSNKFYSDTSPASVPSVASLRGLKKGFTSKVFVEGYYATGDGGGGYYYYDPSDNSSSDNGGTIIVAADGARWKLIHDGEVSAKQFGAKGDGATDDTTAIQRLLNSGATVIKITQGTYMISNIIVPSGVKKFYGDGNATQFVGAGSPVNYSPFITFSSLSSFFVGSFSVNVSITNYPTNHALQFSTCSDGVVRDIVVTEGGNIALYAPGGNNISFQDIEIHTFYERAFFAEDSPSKYFLDNIRVLSKGTAHSIQIVGGGNHKITRCHTYLSPNMNFGINMWKCSDSIISMNDCITDSVEGINIQDSEKITIIGNSVTCLTGHHDFGISIYGQTISCQHCFVVGNRVYFPGKSGIGIASSTTASCRLNHISDNLVISPNQLNESQGSGVILYGGSNCSENTVQQNRLLDEGSTMKYGVSEWNDGNGNPQNNYLINNAVLTGSGILSQNKILTTGSKVWDVNEESYSPVISSSSGTITSYTSSAKYKRNGKFLIIDMSISVTNNGSGAGSIVATLPFSCVNGALNGRENSISGSQLNGIPSGSTLVVRTYNNSYPAATGANIQISGVLEIA